jgi:hypothetical protein
MIPRLILFSNFSNIEMAAGEGVTSPLTINCGALQEVINDIFELGHLMANPESEDDKRRRRYVTNVLVEWRYEWRKQFGRMPPVVSGMSMSSLTLGDISNVSPVKDSWRSDDQEHATAAQVDNNDVGARGGLLIFFFFF